MERKRCPLWYDDGCPYLTPTGECELDHPEIDCDDYYAYSDE